MLEIQLETARPVMLNGTGFLQNAFTRTLTGPLTHYGALVTINLPKTRWKCETRNTGSLNAVGTTSFLATKCQTGCGKKYRY